MKTLLSVITLSLCLTLSAQSYIQLEVISLKEGQEDEYLKIEEFYSEVKRLAVEKDFSLDGPYLRTSLMIKTKLKV